MNEEQNFINKINQKRHQGGSIFGTDKLLSDVYNKVVNKTFRINDDKRTKIDKDDIPDLIERFHNRHKEDNKDRRKKHFFVPIKEIKDKT